MNNALKYDKHINLYGLSSVNSHGKVAYKNYIEGISFITADTFMDELNKVIDEHHIDVLIPAYDDVILYLAKHVDELHCKLVTSNLETCEIARSKVKTYNYLKKYDFIPQMYDINTITEKDLPLFAKPDIGQGSQGACMLKTMSDVERIKQEEEEFVVSELLTGDEYTVDCFTDNEGNLLIASMRERHRTKGGISVNTVTVKLPDEVKSIAECINKELAFDGVWFFQVKIDRNGHYKLLEAAPRVAGSMSLSRVRGFNFILNSVYQTMGYKVKALPHLLDFVEEDRALSNKYILDIDYDIVYLDLDDTLVISGRVNPDVMAFIYQCQNNGKKVRILSRHARREEDTLTEKHIDLGLFDDIIHVEESELKSKYIKEKNAILIDDAFRERYDVSLNCQIPVFDLDCISALMDTQWRQQHV